MCYFYLRNGKTFAATSFLTFVKLYFYTSQAATIEYFNITTNMYASTFLSLFIVIVAQMSFVKSFSLASGSKMWKQSAMTVGRVSKMHMSYTADQKAGLVERLMDAKAASKLSFDQISAKLGVTNAQTAQIFTNQAQLSPRAAELLKVAVPGISAEDMATIQKVPMRSFDPEMMQVWNSAMSICPPKIARLVQTCSFGYKDCLIRYYL